MKSKILKRILLSLLIIAILFCVLMVTPRIWGALFPDKLPVGYHFTLANYIAIGVGLEKLIDRTPDIPPDIEEIKNIEYKNINGKSYGYDPDRIAVIGGSAGGHLALLAAYGWKKADANADSISLPENIHRIKAVVDIYGPVDLTTEYARTYPTTHV